MKSLEKLFGASVALISVTTLITTVAGFAGYPLPRWALWTIGIVNTVSLPLLIDSTVKSLREKARAAEKAAKKSAPKPAAPAAGAEQRTEKAPRPKPGARELAAKKAAAGNKPKKGKKKKK